MATATRTEQAGPTVEHLKDCPADPARIEVDERPVSGKEGQSGAVVTITHCVDCGNVAVFDGTKAERAAALKPATRAKKEADSDGGDQG